MKRILYLCTLFTLYFMNACQVKKSVPTELSFSEKEQQNIKNQQYFNSTTVLGIKTELIDNQKDKAYIDKFKEAKQQIQNTALFNNQNSNNFLKIKKSDQQYTMHINTDADILFAFDSYTLSDTAKTFLSDFAKIVNQNFSHAIITIIGHTDNQGSQEYNLTLSQYRAIAVANFLKIKHVQNEIKTKGKGKLEPICENKTEEGRKKNRRVEIFLTIKKT